MSVLVEIIKSGECDRIASVPNIGRLIDEPDDQLTPLLWSIILGNSLCAHELMRLGADPSIGDEDGLTPLMYAAQNHDLEAVCALIAHGADVNSTSVDGLTCLMRAAAVGDGDIVKVILEKGGDCHKADGAGRTALHWSATEHDCPNVLKMLLQAGAPVDALTMPMGWSPLMYCSWLGREGMVRELLEFGANPAILSADENKSAADLAREAGFVELSDSIIQYTDLSRGGD
ncbi:ankyrin repeat domain-containing protein [Caulobacter sp. KR2-114]